MAIYQIILFVELMLYYMAMTLFSIRLFGASCQWKRWGLLFFLLFVPLLAIELTGDTPAANIASFLFFLPEVIFLKLSLSPIRLRTLLAEYFTLYTVNILLSAALLAWMPDNDAGAWLVELGVHLLMLCVCMLVCYTPQRQRVQQLFEWMPKSTKMILLIKLGGNAFLSAIVLHHPLLTDQVLSNAFKLIFILLQVTDGLIISVLLVYTMTNKQIRRVASHYEEQIKVQSNYYQKLSASHFELRRFRHDANNLLIGLETLLTEGNTEEAVRMLNRGREKLQPLPQFDSGNGVADALLEDKALRGERIHTVIRFEGTVPAVGIEPTDLCVIFGNTLDNALEACEKLPPDEEKTITVQCCCCGGMVLIEMTNPVRDPVVIRDGFPPTTKADKTEHGLGLYSLTNIVKKYNGTVECTCTEGRFVIGINLYVRQPAAASA